MMRTAQTCLVVLFVGIVLRDAVAGYEDDLDPRAYARKTVTGSQS